jgi:hypothetical protein
MNKLIRSLLCLALLVSCNVVKLATQGETQVPDEFFVKDIIPFNKNPMTLAYKDLEKYVVDDLGSMVPGSFAIAKQNLFPSTPYAWSTEWSSDLRLNSNRTNTMVTARDWIAEQIKVQKVDKGGGDSFESITWQILNSTNMMCSVGLLLGNQLGLTDLEYPAFGTYQIEIDKSSAYGLKKYCDMDDALEKVGMSFSVTVGDPASAEYDISLNMMGQLHYLRYDGSTFNYATVYIDTPNDHWHKIFVADDRVTKGLRLEYIQGPDNTGSDDNDEYWMVRMWLGTTASDLPEKPIHLFVHNFHDASGADDFNTFHISGNVNTNDRVSMKMTSSYFVANNTNNEHRQGCLNKSDWSMHTDNTECNVGNEVQGFNTGIDESAPFWNFSTNYNGGLATLQTLSASDTAYFNYSTDMMSSTLPGTTK